jgi:hypothetical protein
MVSRYPKTFRLPAAKITQLKQPLCDILRFGTQDLFFWSAPSAVLFLIVSQRDYG